MKLILIFLTIFLFNCNALEKNINYEVGAEFQHCGLCPQMTVVPSGKFNMGSPETEMNRGDDESPQRIVTVNYDFAVGIFEVTYEQWEHCFINFGCDHNPIDNGWGRGQHPVSNVSCLDANQYVKWLSKQTGSQYRLLTEAEWEYVARAGSTAKFWWGDESPIGKAVCIKCDLSGETNNMSMPVGTYPPNSFGLHDLHGNVWEWVEDCWSKDYSGHPLYADAYKSESQCKRRVLRGGAWPNGGRHLRSANRSWKGPTHRSTNGKGFRVAMTLS